MALGPGKYDDLCTAARVLAEADAAIVIILNGNQGSGFSMQFITLEAVVAMPDILERVATEIREAGPFGG
jgi:hypothetical protein